MQCRTHTTKEAVSACNHCGSWLCSDCAVDTQGKTFCRPCLAIAVGSGEETPPPPGMAGGRTSKPAEKINGGLLFLFSLFFPPGANYMYMGLIKRGLATMSGFFLIIFLITTVSMPLTLFLALSLGVIYLASFFDGFNVRNRINAGEEVRDDVGESLNMILKNKTVRTIFLVVIAVIVLVNLLGFAINIISSVLPIVLIGFIIYLIVKNKK